MPGIFFLFHETVTVDLEPPFPTWINFNPRLSNHMLSKVWFSSGCNNLSTLGLKLSHVNEKATGVNYASSKVGKSKPGM